MSISDIDQRLLKRRLLCFGLNALFCLAFNWIYGMFSHGVGSESMRLMFLYPLILGLAASFLLPKPGLPFDMCCCGIATLTLGGLVEGIMEIAGTASDFSWIYGAAGIALCAGGIGLYFFRAHEDKKG